MGRPKGIRLHFEDEVPAARAPPRIGLDAELTLVWARRAVSARRSAPLWWPAAAFRSRSSAARVCGELVLLDAPEPTAEQVRMLFFGVREWSVANPRDTDLRDFDAWEEDCSVTDGLPKELRKELEAAVAEARLARQLTKASQEKRVCFTTPPKDDAGRSASKPRKASGWKEDDDEDEDMPFPASLFPAFGELWRLLAVDGWTVKKATGLADWLYIPPDREEQAVSTEAAVVDAVRHLSVSALRRKYRTLYRYLRTQRRQASPSGSVGDSVGGSTPSSTSSGSSASPSPPGQDNAKAAYLVKNRWTRKLDPFGGGIVWVRPGRDARDEAGVDVFHALDDAHNFAVNAWRAEAPSGGESDGMSESPSSPPRSLSPSCRSTSPSPAPKTRGGPAAAKKTAVRKRSSGKAKAGLPKIPPKAQAKARATPHRRKKTAAKAMAPSVRAPTDGDGFADRIVAKQLAARDAAQAKKEANRRQKRDARRAGRSRETRIAATLPERHHLALQSVAAAIQPLREKDGDLKAYISVPYARSIWRDAASAVGSQAAERAAQHYGFKYAEFPDDLEALLEGHDVPGVTNAPHPPPISTVTWATEVVPSNTASSNARKPHRWPAIWETLQDPGGWTYAKVKGGKAFSHLPTYVHLRRGGREPFKGGKRGDDFFVDGQEAFAHLRMLLAEENEIKVTLPLFEVPEDDDGASSDGSSVVSPVAMPPPAPLSEDSDSAWECSAEPSPSPSTPEGEVADNGGLLFEALYTSWKDTRRILEALGWGYRGSIFCDPVGKEFPNSQSVVTHIVGAWASFPADRFEPLLAKERERERQRRASHRAAQWRDRRREARADRRQRKKEALARVHDEWERKFRGKTSRRSQARKAPPAARSLRSLRCQPAPASPAPSFPPPPPMPPALQSVPLEDVRPDAPFFWRLMGLLRGVGWEAIRGVDDAYTFIVPNGRGKRRGIEGVDYLTSPADVCAYVAWQLRNATGAAGTAEAATTAAAGNGVRATPAAPGRDLPEQRNRPTPFAAPASAAASAQRQAKDFAGPATPEQSFWDISGRWEALLPALRSIGWEERGGSFYAPQSQSPYLQRRSFSDVDEVHAFLRAYPAQIFRWHDELAPLLEELGWTLGRRRSCGAIEACVPPRPVHVDMSDHPLEQLRRPPRLGPFTSVSDIRRFLVTYPVLGLQDRAFLAEIEQKHGWKWSTGRTPLQDYAYTPPWAPKRSRVVGVDVFDTLADVRAFLIARPWLLGTDAEGNFVALEADVSAAPPAEAASASEAEMDVEVDMELATMEDATIGAIATPEGDASDAESDAMSEVSDAGEEPLPASQASQASQGFQQRRHSPRILTSPSAGDASGEESPAVSDASEGSEVLSQASQGSPRSQESQRWRRSPRTGAYSPRLAVGPLSEAAPDGEVAETRGGTDASSQGSGSQERRRSPRMPPIDAGADFSRAPTDAATRSTPPSRSEASPGSRKRCRSSHTKSVRRSCLGDVEEARHTSDAADPEDADQNLSQGPPKRRRSPRAASQESSGNSSSPTRHARGMVAPPEQTLDLAALRARFPDLGKALWTAKIGVPTPLGALWTALRDLGWQHKDHGRLGFGDPRAYMAPLLHGESRCIGVNAFVGDDIICVAELLLQDLRDVMGEEIADTQALMTQAALVQPKEVEEGQEELHTFPCAASPPPPRRAPSPSVPQPSPSRFMGPATSSVARLRAASAALAKRVTPASPRQRREELSRLTAFLTGACDGLWTADDSAGAAAHAIYLCGAPGTGKTLTARSALAALAEHAIAAGEAPPRVHWASGTEASQPGGGGLFGAMLASFLPGSSARSQPQQRLDKLLAHAGTDEVCILVLDECDQLWSRNHRVLKTLFQWAARPRSRLVVVGIANGIDFVSRQLPDLVRLGAEPETLVFAPYTVAQLSEILVARAGDVVAPRAAEVCARKVAAKSGDARRALDMLKTAVEHRLYELERGPGDGREPTGALVNIREVKRAMHGSSLGVLAADMKAQTMGAQRLLVAMTTLGESFSDGQLREAYSRGCRASSLEPMGLRDFEDTIQTLEGEGIVEVEGMRKKRASLSKKHNELLQGDRSLRLLAASQQVQHVLREMPGCARLLEAMTM